MHTGGVVVSLIDAAIAKAVVWLAKRGKGVSKHISHHTRSAANAAKRNPRYLKRVLGSAAHTVFRDPRPKKLIEAALRQPDAKLLRPNGVVWVEKQFNRVVGKNGETIIRVWIDSRTGRIITAFPVARTFAAAAVAAGVPAGAFGAVMDDHVAATVEGMERIAADWKHAHRQSTSQEVAETLIEFLLAAVFLDSSPAGDPDEGLHVKLYNYLDQQAWAVVNELQKAAGGRIPDDAQQTLRAQFRDAVAGAVLDDDD